MRRFGSVLMCLLIPALAGCTAAAISATGAGLGASYTINNIAYRTFSYPAKRVEDATLAALGKMGFKAVDHYGLDKRIEATAKDLNIVITVEHITDNTTRMMVDARKGFFFKDKATALEIIAQASRILEAEVVEIPNSL